MKITIKMKIKNDYNIQKLYYTQNNNITNNKITEAIK